MAAEEANACQLKLPPEGEAAGTTAAADPQAQTAGAAKGTDAAGQKHPDAADPGTGIQGLPWLAERAVFMIYLESPSTDPFFNLALEEYAFQKLDPGEEYFMLWRNRRR